MLTTSSDAMSGVVTNPPTLPRRRSLGKPFVATLLISLTVVASVVNIRYFSASPARVHINNGAALAISGKPRDAEKEWRLALKADPSNLEPYQLLSNLYLEVGEPEK